MFKIILTQYEKQEKHKLLQIPVTANCKKLSRGKLTLSALKQLSRPKAINKNSPRKDQNTLHFAFQRLIRHYDTLPKVSLFRNSPKPLQIIPY